MNVGLCVCAFQKVFVVLTEFAFSWPGLNVNESIQECLNVNVCISTVGCLPFEIMT